MQPLLIGSGEPAVVRTVSDELAPAAIRGQIDRTMASRVSPLSMNGDTSAFRSSVRAESLVVGTVGRVAEFVGLPRSCALPKAVGHTGRRGPS